MKKYRMLILLDMVILMVKVNGSYEKVKQGLKKEVETEMRKEGIVLTKKNCEYVF
jgi:hypothetical protein